MPQPPTFTAVSSQLLHTSWRSGKHLIMTWIKRNTDFNIRPTVIPGRHLKGEHQDKRCRRPRFLRVKNGDVSTHPQNEQSLEPSGRRGEI
jgi:hypothetical protein